MKLESTIYLIAFLCGVFLTLSLYILYKYYYSKETFEVDISEDSVPDTQTQEQTAQQTIEQQTAQQTAQQTIEQTAQPQPQQATTNSAVLLQSVANFLPQKANLNIPPETIESSTNSTPVQDTQDTTNKYMSMLTLPKKNDNFMLLTTFNNLVKIRNDELRWYHDSVDIKDVLMTDFNKGIFFSLGNAVSFETDKLIQQVQGANLQNTQLTGPIALYFSNSEKSPFELSQFSLLFMIKIHAIQGTNTIFEMLCNTSVVDGFTSSYIANAISMKLVEIDDKYFNIDIIFGTENYSVPRLEKHLLVNDSINLLALTFNTANIVVRINSVPYTYTYNKNAITLGSLPVIINKNGTLPMVMYSMAYYKKALTATDMIEYIRYNMFYFNGINLLLEEQKKYLSMISDSDNNKSKIEQMTRMLDKCAISDISDLQKKDVNVNALETPYPSKMSI
jgi:hypothetical protein